MDNTLAASTNWVNGSLLSRIRKANPMLLNTLFKAIAWTHHVGVGVRKRVSHGLARVESVTHDIYYLGTENDGAFCLLQPLGCWPRLAFQKLAEPRLNKWGEGVLAARSKDNSAYARVLRGSHNWKRDGAPKFVITRNRVKFWFVHKMVEAKKSMGLPAEYPKNLI